MTSYGTYPVKRKPMIISREGQELLIQRLIGDNIVLPCDLSTVHEIQPKLHNLDAVSLKYLQNNRFYDTKVQEGIRCAFSSIVAPSSSGVVGAERFFYLLGKMKKIGEGVNGVAMTAGMKEKNVKDRENLMDVDIEYSEHGNFAYLDPEQLVIAKLEKGETGDNMREFLIGCILNRLRNFIPNFTQVYGILGCDSVYDRDFFCSDNGNKAVLLMENIEGITMEKWLFRAENTIENQKKLFSIIFQLFNALYYAYHMYGFTHNDLHGNNIMLRELDTDCYLPLLFQESDTPIFLRTHIFPAFIDYGFSRILINAPPSMLDQLKIPYTQSDIFIDKHYQKMVQISIGTRSFEDFRGLTSDFKGSYGPQQSSPMFDVFRFTTTLYNAVLPDEGNPVGKPLLKEVFDVVMSVFPSAYQVNSKEDILYWKQRYFSLSPNEADFFEERGATLHAVLTRMTQIYSEKYPSDCIILQTLANFQLIDRNLPVLACSTQLMERMQRHPLISHMLPTLNISCETSLSDVFHKLGLTNEGLRFGEDLILFYDYIMMTGTTQLQTVKEKRSLYASIVKAEEHFKQFANPSLKRAIDDVFNKSSEGAITKENMHFLDEVYKNRNIALKNIQVLLELKSMGILPEVLTNEREETWRNVAKYIYSLKDVMERITEMILMKAPDKEVKEKATTLSNTLRGYDKIYQK